jgi:ubiquitin C-terminal hydrolase
MVKLMHRVLHPLELRLVNTTDDSEQPDRIFDLFAVVVHVGSEPSQGHYVTLVRSHGTWLLFDDDRVDAVDADTLASFYGLTESQLRTSKVAFYFQS